MIAVIASGCIVSADSQPAHPSWPKPVAIRHINQFDGVYRNRSLDDNTGKPAKNGTELFEMLTSSTEPRGTRMEIRSSRTGDALHVRLFDDRRRQITSSELRRGIDFSLSDESLILHRQPFGWEGGSTNIGAALRHSSFGLHLSTSGGLLGRYTEGGVAFAAYVIPMAGSLDEWMFWPKLSP